MMPPERIIESSIPGDKRYDLRKLHYNRVEEELKELEYSDACSTGIQRR
jgi:hypothetical protein